MNQSEFVSKIIGTPWINRGYAFDGCDCFGLVYLYMKHVQKTVVGLSGEYMTGVEFTKSFMAQLDAGKWVKVDTPSSESVVFMMFNGDIPMHCGIMLNKVDCLHTFGGEDKGKVVVWKLRQLKRHIKFFHSLEAEPRVEFYQWQS